MNRCIFPWEETACLVLITSAYMYHDCGGGKTRDTPWRLVLYLGISTKVTPKVPIYQTISDPTEWGPNATLRVPATERAR